MEAIEPRPLSASSDSSLLIDSSTWWAACMHNTTSLLSSVVRPLCANSTAFMSAWTLVIFIPSDDSVCLFMVGSRAGFPSLETANLSALPPVRQGFWYRYLGPVCAISHTSLRLFQDRSECAGARSTNTRASHDELVKPVVR